MEMEELHAAAFAYYRHGTPQLQQLAWSFFQSMDTNKDNQISWSEFYEFLQQSGYNWIVNDPSFFEKLDHNRDGHLDFSEVLTFYYIIKTRNILCRGCRVNLRGLYFTCVACFNDVGLDHHQGTYDLCAACYGNSNFHHHHTYFLDNHVLLRSKRGLPPCVPPDLNLAINVTPVPWMQTITVTPVPWMQAITVTPVPPSPLVIYNNYYFQAPERRKWYQAYSLLETAVNAVVATASVAANCTIM